MTVSSQTSRIEQLGDGTTTAFAVNFYFLENSDLKVFVNGVLQTITTNYTVTGAGNPAGGTVTFVTAPANGVQVVIFRDPAVTQGLDYIDNDPFPAESHERGLDKLTMIAQRVKDLVSRALRLGDSVVGVDTELPALTSSQLLGTKPDGSGFQLYPLGSTPQSAASTVYTPAGTGAAATTVQSQLRFIQNSEVIVEDAPFYAVGGGVVDDTAAIQSALDSGAKKVTFLAGPYKLSSSIIIPANITVEFKSTVIKGHFADFLIQNAFPGETVYIGKLVLTDDDASVVSAATTLTKGIKWGDTGNAIHGTDTSACDIYCSKLLQAYYFGEFSYSNNFGALRAFDCGNLTTDAVLFAAGAGLLAANDNYIQKLEILGSNTATWNGAGLNVSGGYGITFGQLHIESIYNANGAQFNNCCVSVLGGYFESVGATATSNTLYVNAGSTVTFNGALINCPVDLDVRTRFIGCRFFKQEMYLRATYIDCTFPESRNLALDVTGLEVGDFPVFGTSSAEQLFRNFSGNWTEFGVGYTAMTPDFDYFGGDHAETFISDAWSSGIAMSSFRNSPGSGYFGALGFRLPDHCANSKVFAWGIVRIPSVAGVNFMRLGVGGILDTGSFNADSISTLSNTPTTVDRWFLYVMPNATLFTSATYGNSSFFFFEGGVDDQNDKFHVDCFGVETGGLSYKSLGTSQAPQSKTYLKGTAAPTTGTWAAGDRMIQSVPTVGQPKAWVCTVSGTPGTWVSEGNL